MRRWSVFLLLSSLSPFERFGPRIEGKSHEVLMLFVGAAMTRDDEVISRRYSLCPIVHSGRESLAAILCWRLGQLRKPIPAGSLAPTWIGRSLPFHKTRGFR